MGNSIAVGTKIRPETGTWDPIWEKVFRNKKWGKYPPEHIVRFIAQSFYGSKERSQVRLLEVGCGPGANVWFMVREGFTVSGIDGSSTAIQQAQQRLAGEGLSADLRVGDLARLPWPDAVFDGAVENVSLYCNPLAAVERALDEVHRVLRPGAPFLSSFFSNRTWGYGQGDRIEQDGYTNIPEGPLSGSGFCLFLSRDRVDVIFHRFQLLAVERITRTLDNEQHLIEQLVVTCRKPDS
ncbi:MAG: class I SAM-dependent methyltransferase [Acidobacteriaceae bacterium]|nr:class I SAM-dependent methyltransferase [Acidobacteriaceae bacterium]